MIGSRQVQDYPDFMRRGGGKGKTRALQFRLKAARPGPHAAAHANSKFSLSQYCPARDHEAVEARPHPVAGKRRL